MKLILGGGISGLSTAYYLSKKCPKELLTIIEASDHIGGWIKSRKLPDGTIFEQGPRTLRPKGLPGANTLQLIEDLNLSERIRPITMDHSAAKNRMIFANGELHMLPSSLSSIFQLKKPFSRPLIVSLLFEGLQPSIAVSDESIYNFTYRRFGPEVADYLISPMICGICAGNAKEISVKFLMEPLFAKEQKYGSITKGFLKTLQDKKEELPKSDLLEKSTNEKWSIYSFKEGLEELPKALHQKALENGNNIVHNECTGIDFDDKIRLTFKSGDGLIGNHLFSTIPAQKLSPLLTKQHPKLSALLSNIETVSVGVVNLKFNKKLLKQEGFGFLVAPKENLPILGVIYDSCCFPSGENTTITVMMGGHWFNKHFPAETKEEKFLEIALDQIRNILDITEVPDAFKVNVLKDCIPQYNVGHSENLENINAYIKENNLRLSLCGSSYYGIGVNDVILSAKNAVDKL
ncbi:PREDICTED: protoporphyrinogen oxidase [Nicrophorus vespilloides]|uniref:Protoporphyrinogen oxidase n=1 Tax=Nicrophorus vespilloides TaxID=110193 RepID=A0ABM1MDF0_NICVS|nr:PREDICTED: protoporphyrinogen oxidase [Nicrophorus vespilloides]